MEEKILDTQTDMAFELAHHLQMTTEKYRSENQELGMKGIIGAANLYLISLFAHADSKEQALALLEQDFDIIRNIIRNSSELMYQPELNETR